MHMMPRYLIIDNQDGSCPPFSNTFSDYTLKNCVVAQFSSTCFTKEAKCGIRCVPLLDSKLPCGPLKSVLLEKFVAFLTSDIKL